MSVAEQAIADSRRILEAGLLDIFFPDASGNVLAASNADFYNAFLNLVGGGEAYRNRDGSVRQNLSPRIRAAVLAAMLNPERRETVERLLDNPEGYNALINGLMQCAANLAELANKPEYDLSGELSQAVELFVETRDKGQTVDEFAAQTDMFREAPSAETMFLMRLFEENAKSSGGISGVLRQYAAECKKIDTTTQSLFGEENPTKLEKLEEAYRHYAADLSNEAGNGNLRWRDTGEPAAEEISEAQKQYEEVKSKYVGTPLWMKAPNGKRTNLTEEQWVRVRTPNFKRWFGDWETLAVINEIKDMSAKPVKLHEALDKAGIKEAFKNFGEVANERDGRKVVFPSASAGKIRRHKGFDSNTIIKHFKSLFKASIPILSEKEEIKEGHKAHGNIESVEHYVNKFSVNGSEYYIRFTVPIIRNDRSAGNVHSSAISEVSIYKNGDSTLYPLNTAGSSSPSFIDRKLSDFLNSVKPENVSKVVDENGEPLAVYHGSTAMFNEFRSKFIGHSTGTADGRGFYFTTDKSYAEGFKSKDGRVIEAFLNIRDLLDYKKKTITKAALKKIIKEIDRAEFEADGEHYFISNFGNYYDEGIDKVIDEATESNYDFCDTDVEIFNVLITSGADFDLTAKAIKNVTGKDGEIVPKDNNTTHFIIFNSNQAKSATDNIGTFNTNNPDIRWRLDEGAAELDARHAELYERYKGGDEAAYGEALELVADEARRNGYDVKVYHGTGADGFNVAKADASEAQNGEGAQAHGMGLYMAENKSIAEAYQEDAPKEEIRTIGGRTLEELGITPEKFDGFPVVGLVPTLAYFGVEDTKREINERIKKQETRLKSSENAFAKTENDFGKKLAQETIDNAKQQITNDKKALSAIDKILSILEENGLSISDYEYRISDGKLFDWFTNLKPGEVIDENKPLSEQPEILEKFKNAWIDMWAYVKRKRKGKRYWEWFNPDKLEKDGYRTAGSVFRKWSEEYGRKETTNLLLKNGIRGITYDGRRDGRCFVSFEGGATVKLQDPFTFDDEGNLIPLSERFDETNPDMRWKIDDPSPERVEKLRAARPVEIGENDYKGLYELNAKSAREYVLKKLRGRKYVNADTGDEIEIGQVGARKLLSHDRYNKDYLRSFVAIPQMIENAVYLGEEPNEKGNGKYDKYRYYACGLKIGGRDYTARLTIGESEGKWYYDQALTQIEKGDLIKRLLTLNSRVRPLTGSPNGFIDNRLISLLQENNSENSSRLRFLLRQERRENPVIWASIVLAKQILLGRAITSARLDRVLPPERFDGTKREYAVNRAREIAERYRADKEKFGNDLNLGVQRAENDLYWTRDVVEEMYASFRRDGEEYGIARQRLMEWLKEQRRRDLETVKGLSSEELGIDVPSAIEDALEKEPERRKPGESAAEESGVETFEASGEGIDAEIESAREKPAPSSIRDIIGKIRAGVTKAAKARGMDEAARRRAYRNTLAEVLRESARRLTYGREREAIMKKISDLSAKGYSVIKIKDGERAGQKIDNYTLRAEHIALRIFNRGVRDTKRELSEKFEKIVSRKGKKPSRMERDDKRALAGAVQMRVYNIKRYSEMDAAELEAEYSATVDKLENVEKNFAERIRHYGAFAKAISKEIRKRAAIVQYGLPPFPASDTIQYRPLCGQSKRRKREQKSSNPKMRCITCESDKTLARLISIKLDLSLYASAPDSYCHASLAA